MMIAVDDDDNNNKSVDVEGQWQPSNILNEIYFLKSREKQKQAACGGQKDVLKIRGDIISYTNYCVYNLHGLLMDIVQL